MTSQIIPVDPFDFIIFGGTGDLAERKLLPALFHRQQAGQRHAFGLRVSHGDILRAGGPRDQPAGRDGRTGPDGAVAAQDQG